MSSHERGLLILDMAKNSRPNTKDGKDPDKTLIRSREGRFIPYTWRITRHASILSQRERGELVVQCRAVTGIVFLSM